jgi:hypothetical protein
MKNENNILQSAADYDYLKASSAQDCTGLIPSGIVYEEELENRLSLIEAAKTTVYKLSLDEEVALTQIDAMKEEIVNICRIKRDGGKDGFKLPSHKDADTGASEATMHDDRAYVLAMLGWYLSEKRIENVRNKKRPKTDAHTLISSITIRPAKRLSAFDD